MMFKWTSDMVSFMKTASERTEYYKKICECLKPYLNENSHVCDAGCGLGYSSVELSKYSKSVLSVDINENALEVLKSNIASNNISNIDIKIGSMDDVRGSFDAMLFCLFGEHEDIIRWAKALCKGKVLVVGKNYDNHRFSPGNKKHHHRIYPDCIKYFDQIGLKYEAFTRELEFGQPLRSVDEARLFFKTYSDESEYDKLTDEFILGKLEITDDSEYPFYLPEERKLGFILFDTSDIPEFI